MLALENDVRILERELENINRKKTKAYEYIWEPKTQGDEVVRRLPSVGLVFSYICAQLNRIFVFFV